MPGSSTDRPASGFAAQLIAALEEAQAAVAQPKPAAQLAQAAWSKLQYDFPVVSQEELAALVQEYASGTRRDVSTQFLSVLRENAGAAASSEPTTAAPGLSTPSSSAANAASTASAAAGEDAFVGSGSSSSSAAGPVPLYQQLYALAVVQSLQACLEAPESAALQQLAGMQPRAAESVWGAEGMSQMEAMLAAAAEGLAGAEIELEHRLSQQEDDDSTAYEPLEATQPPRLQQWHAAPGQQQQHAAAGSDATGLPGLLAELASHLSYHSMADVAAWRELHLMQRLVACIAATRQHTRFTELHAAGAVQPLLRLAADRFVAAPVELEASLPALLGALGISAPGGNSSHAAASRQDSTAAAAAAAELGLATAVALAAQLRSPSARRQLWQEVHTRLLPVAAQQLEQQQVALARQARSAGAGAGAPTWQPSPEQLYAVMLPCQLLYFYVLQAPPGMAAAVPGSGSSSRLEQALLQGGLLRSLVLLFVQLGAQPGAEPLRCALLLACAAAKPVAAWAAAVPGFTAATAVPAMQPGGEAQLHGAMWQMLLSGAGGPLAALLTDAEPADKVPAVYQALQLMADVQVVARRPLWGGQVEGALRGLADTLRQRYGRAAREEREEQQLVAAGAAAGAGAGGAAAGAVVGYSEQQQEEGRRDDVEDVEDAKKLALGAAEASVALSERRAAQLQPACAKLIKDLLLQRGGPGGSGGGKHD